VNGRPWSGTIARMTLGRLPLVAAIVLPAVYALAACGGDDSTTNGGNPASSDSGAPDATTCNVGSERCSCTLGGACDRGLVCLSGLCVRPDNPDASESDANTRSTDGSDGAAVQTEAGQDAAKDAANCSTSSQCQEAGLPACCCNEGNECMPMSTCVETGVCL
jgi:hypothetical protein